MGHGTLFEPRAVEARRRSCAAVNDAIESAWKICQPILDRWMEKDREIPKYEAGTWGPRESDMMIESEGRFWRKV